MSDSNYSPGATARLPYYRSLRGKLTVLLVVVGLAPLLVMGFLGGRQATESMRELAGENLADLAFNASDKLDRNLFERYGDVQAYAQSDAAKSMDPKQIGAWMDTMTLTYTPIYNLMVAADASGKIVAVNKVDSNGQPIASEVLVGLDVSNQEWFKTALSGSLQEGKSFVEDLHEDGLMTRVFGSGPKSYAMSFTYPIRDAGGKIVGVWSNRFNWQVVRVILDDVLKRANQGEEVKSIRLHLVNHEGVVLASDNQGDTLNLRLQSHPVVNLSLVANASGFKEEKGFGDADGEKMIGYYRSTGYSTYPGVGWAALASQDKSEALHAATQLDRTLLLIGLVTALALIVVAFLIARSIANPVQAVVGQLRALATGGADLRARLPEAARDEVGQLAHAFNSFMDSLGGIVRGLIDTSAKLASGTTQIAAASNEMSAGAESQTQQVLRTSSAMEEMSVTIKEVARNAQSTASATEAAVTRARHGTHRVQAALASINSTNTSLQDLRRRSAEIEQVVKLIADIAAQTNILALNAAIEAAGAGAAGARFDVVAEEIRKLAGRTAESTTRISATVGEIRSEMQGAAERMESTASQAEEIGQSLEDIGEVITSVNDMVAVISSSTTEQARAAEEVADALQLITQVSQQTAQAARETTLTIDDLAGLARDMNVTAGRFKV
jgi:methyl-accepting chemotaxis protein